MKSGKILLHVLYSIRAYINVLLWTVNVPILDFSHKLVMLSNFKTPL